ncbi:NAD-binding protein [Frankia sp. CcI156]|uniref:NAD-binding protein, putative n=1 Tax=Frankia casuarinae (strain DSM 45818 / CECT 9043 / HFP020203 / CcI3) TaxID=106370 RepID=Q2JBF0_FRACC|nr:MULTISPECIES: NAD(P)H-binding protein [Frankia]ABD11392.1 NAD-binding protein, putative [Frankia casuarinae]ETA01521.1 putative NADH-flavin reductase [Frankia sp. CcI6]EYT91892.1 putative NADH-flavin reductase [Frankia casuarinae]KDA42681.1 putative NADH-flavin reductase [Frankia sp. BMG5.23]KEZ35526.1 putative NADH-flavin reductase [Frankia sp. CeD]
MNIVVFGAGGRAGRQVLAEAGRRGHRVTAVMRDPARHGDLPSDARVVAGDVTDAVSVERAAAGQDAAISAAVDLSTPAHDFFTASSRALATGLARAGVRRLVVVGLSSILPGASGAALMDEPGYPNEYRSFFLGHAAGLDVLRACELDWVYVAPAGDFDHDGARTGRYRVAEHGDPASRIGYADFAIALLDEIEEPRHHRATVSVQ